VGCQLAVLGQHQAQLALVPDQGPIQTLGPYRAYPALRVGVRPRRLLRDLHHVDARSGCGCRPGSSRCWSSRWWCRCRSRAGGGCARSTHPSRSGVSDRPAGPYGRPLIARWVELLGKTTAARACVGLGGVVVHDFDEIGAPSTADVGSRQHGMERWLRRVLDYQQAGLDVLLLGQSPLGEVLASPSAICRDGIAACLLDVAGDERLRRLERRDPSSRAGSGVQSTPRYSCNGIDGAASGQVIGHPGWV
jgi:hypothetical protein